MTEYDPSYATGEQWFLPPEGILDGTDFDIAQRYIDGMRADHQYHVGNENMDPVLRARHVAAGVELEEMLAGFEARLGAGDEELATVLAARMELEVDELNRGERSALTGQAHLVAERTRRVGSIFHVPRPAGPSSPES